MLDQSRFCILGAFALGAVLAIAFNTKPLRPTQDGDDIGSERKLKQQQKLISRCANISDLVTLKKSLAEIESSLEKGQSSIKEGIEGCIGDTPLIKIKSLSEYTGCEILAKAEVEL